jgi:hypothetical protein
MQTIRDSVTHEITTNPYTIISTIQSYHVKEHSRTKPDNIPITPWQNPENPDAYTNNHTKPPQQQVPLNEILTRAHYTMACQRASTGKAPRPDTIPNEVIKFLPENAHDVIYSLFTIMAKHSYIPPKWCTSVTKLIYEPNKKDPNNPANYRPIALMNCILKLWTSTLTIIGTQSADSGGRFIDTTDGFRSHRNIYDSISTHITMYEDAKLSQKNIYAAYSDFKGAFGGMDRRILFQIMKEYGFQDSYINTCK